MKRLAVISAAFISFLALTSVASAQYPPPEDSVAIFVSDPTPPPNSFVFLTFTVQDSDDSAGAQGQGQGRGRGGGAPACRASIVSQPGDDAFVVRIPGAFLPGFGAALLFTGSTPGPIVVAVECPSGASGEVTVMVTSSPMSIAAVGDSGDPLTAGQPDAAASGGGGAGGSGQQTALLLGAVAVLGLAGIGGVGRFMLTRKRE